MIGVVCGLAAEAEALGRWRHDRRIAVEITGARPDRAEAAAERLAAAGAAALLGWGLAGGLTRTLRPGTVLRGGDVVTEDGARLPLADHGEGWGHLFLGMERIVMSRGERARLRAETGAVLVDLEDHRIAAVAARRGLPALAVRAIANDAGTTMPGYVTHAVGAHGHPRMLAVLLGVAARPQTAPTLFRLRRDARLGLAGLRRFAERDLAAIVETYAG